MTKQRFFNRLFHFAVLIAVFALLVTTSVYITNHVTTNEDAQEFVQEFGHVGVLLISFVIGVSVISPVPAGTFSPIFTAGGIDIITVILLAVVGTMLANFVSYFIGRLGHDFTNTNYPKIQKKVIEIYEEKKAMVPFLIFGFAAFIPLPDEIYLIPLGVMGVKIRDFIIPLFLGTLFFQTVTALGFQNIFQLVL